MRAARELAFATTTVRNPSKADINAAWDRRPLTMLDADGFRLTMTQRFLLSILTVTLTLAALVVGSAPADAAQLDLVGASPRSPRLYPSQVWANDSYAPTYPGVVQLTFSPGALTCGSVQGAVGCTEWSRWPVPHVQIDAGEGPYLAHKYLMHELGHVFDATEMQDQFRAQFMGIWRLSGGADGWWTPLAGGHGSAGEWFAESYRLCALYGPHLPYRTWLADFPSYGFPGAGDSARQEASCRLILNVGAAAGLPAPARPALYPPRLVVQADRKMAECRGMDLLAHGNPVRCQRVGGGVPAGSWSVVIQSRHLSRSQLRRARLMAVGGGPAFRA
jgi:hypothetical protein